MLLMIYPSKQRHTSATLLLYGGVNVRQVQERLGHGNLKTTNIYLHCIAEADEEAAKTIYYSTHDVRFIRRVREAFESKYEAYSSKKPPSSIDILPLNEEKKVVTNYKGTWINAYHGIFQLYGEPEHLQFMYDVGLGAKTSQGFGMFEVIE